MQQQLEQLTQLGTELQAGMTALKTAQDQAKKDTDGLITEKVGKIATDLGEKFEKLQDEQQSIKATLERVAANDNNPKKADEAANLEKKEAFLAYVRNGERGLTEAHQKALSTDNLANGGYLVTPQMLGLITGRIFETSPMRRVANVITTNNKSVEMVLDDDEAGAVWAGEGDTVSETNTPALGRLEIVAKKLAAYPKVTNEMLQDSSIDIEAWLINKLADKFGRTENTAFITGNGVNAPKGILAYAAATGYERNKLEQIVNGSTSAPTEAGLIKLMGALKEPYQARAQLLMKRDTFIQFLLLSGTNVFRFFNLQPQSGPQGKVLGPQLTLLEKPVNLADDMPGIGSNSLSVAYGDFGTGYTIVDRTSISVLRDPYTAPGFQKFYAEKRTGGGVTNFEAIKLLKFSAS